MNVYVVLVELDIDAMDTLSVMYYNHLFDDQFSLVLLLLMYYQLKIVVWNE